MKDRRMHIVCFFISLIINVVFFSFNVYAQDDKTDPFVVVSLGDSYSSGEGIPAFYGEGNEIADKVKNYDWLAHRSTKSWPSLIKNPNLDASLNITMSDFKCNPQELATGKGYGLLYDEEDLSNPNRLIYNCKWYFVASSGAVTKDIYTDDSSYKGQKKVVKQPNIYDGKEHYEYLPLQTDVFDYVDDDIDYVTLSIGGNDVDFAEVIKKCACEPSYITRSSLLKKKLGELWGDIDTTKSNLKKAYQAINERVDDQTYILVAGYPKLLEKNGKGKAISIYEAFLVNDSVNRFNDVIKGVVNECAEDGMNIRFVDVETIFDESGGHQAYSKEAWINPIYLGSETEDLNYQEIASRYSMHPNEEGAKAYAHCVNEEIKALEIGAAVSGQIVDKNDKPVEGLTVTISTPVKNRVMYSGVTDLKGEFRGDIKQLQTGIRVTISDENGMLYDTVLNDKAIEPGINDLGKFKLNNYEGIMVVEIKDQEAINALYEQTIADYDKMMHEGQLSYREKNRDTYEEADRYTYYTVVDIDGNGVDELILRFDHQDANHWTNQDSGYGESTYVYTIKDGVVVNVLLPESSVQGFAPDFVHLGFTKIYKGTNLINRGMYHLPQDDIFYSYQDGVLSKDPVLEITRGDDTWLINHEKKTPEECIEAYNTAANNDEGYELQLYERDIVSNSTGDNNKSSLIEEYIQFIKAKNDGSDFQNYIIYDIDKDGYPELLILVGIPEERRSVYEIYSYKSGRFEFQTQCQNCMPHGPAAYASYPDGNGMIAHFSFRGAEGVILLSLNGYEMVKEPLYTEKLENHPTQYYLDEYDNYYQDSYLHNNYINHQFYVGENASPYYDGSYLLGQSAMDNFTAVYEAFGAEEEIITSSENNDNTFMGISPLDPGVEINTASNGNTYRIRYESTEKSDEYVGLNLYVNDIAESYRLDAVYYPSIENVYVTDIDISDSYRNIVVVIYGEDDDSSTYLFAFNENEIHLISEFQGRLVPESVCGDGKVLLVFWIGMSIQNYGSFTVRPEIMVHDLTAKQEALHSGRTTYSDEKANYEEGFEVIIKKEISVYSDASMTEAKGIIPAGSSVKCEYTNEYINEPYGRVFYVSDGSTEGYVTSRFFRDCCDDVKFVG